MLTQMTDADWEMVVEAFRAARSRRGDKGRDDRKFLEALHFFAVHNITWRALPAEFGPWNSVWKRFWRLSQRGVFEAMLAILAGMSGTAHLVQMVDFDDRARACLGGRRKRMARPVCKRFPRPDLSSLHQRIRSQGRTLAKMEIRASRAS